MDQLAKNNRIKETIHATRQRHDDMDCRVVEVKAVPGKLSKTKVGLLNTVFCEGKWLRNSELSKGDPAKFDRNAKTATVKVGDTFEERPLTLLGSQIKQDIVDALKSEMRGLATKKAKGERVGRLRFKSYCNSIPLRQHGNTYTIDFANNAISIQKLKNYPIKVRGLSQIPEGAELANAKLVRKPSGYYFHITVYCPRKEYAATGHACGIDFGIGNNLTLTTGEVINITVPEDKGVKLASRRMHRSYHKNGGKKTSNHRKRVKRVQAAYEKLNNRKRDISNKVVSQILSENDFIAIQDEMISAWHKGLFGKQVQHSSMGFIKRRLKTNRQVYTVERAYPSTQKCPVCGKNTKHPLSKRSYDCQYCGYHHPSRDIKAATMILMEAINQVSAERRAQSPVEAATSAAGHFRAASGKLPPTKQEAQVL